MLPVATWTGAPGWRVSHGVSRTVPSAWPVRMLATPSPSRSATARAVVPVRVLLCHSSRRVAES